MQVEFEIQFGSGIRQVQVGATAFAALDESGGTARENDSPVGLASPELAGWIEPGGRRLDGQQTVTIPATHPGPWTVLIQLIDNSATRVDVTITDEA